MSTDRTVTPSETKPRRLTSTTPVTMPTSTRIALAVMGFVLGVAAALFGGAIPALVISLTLVVLAASFLFGRLRDRVRATIMPITLTCVASVPMVLSGAPTIWILLSFAGAAYLGQTLGTASRSRAETHEGIVLATDPATVPGRTVLVWRMEREQFEVLDPSEKRIRTVIRGPKGNIPSSIEFRRGTAGLDVLRPADVPVTVLQTDDTATGPWFETIDPGTPGAAAVSGGPIAPAAVSTAPPSKGALRDRAIDAAIHFSRTGERLPTAPWMLTPRT